MSDAGASFFEKVAPRPAMRGLASVAVVLIVLDVAVRVVWLALYLPSLDGFSVPISLPIETFATFPAILLPALVTFPGGRSGRKPPAVIAGAFVLAAGELAVAIEIALNAPPDGRSTVLTETVLPVVMWLLLAAGCIVLARGLFLAWSLTRTRTAMRLLGVLLVVPLLLAIGALPFGFGSASRALTFFETTAVLPFGAAWLAWVGLLAWLGDRRLLVRQLAAVSGVLVFVGALLPGLYAESAIVGLRWGGDLRWEVQSLLLGLGLLALAAVLTLETRRGWRE